MMMLHGRRGGLYASSSSSSVWAALCASRREVHSSLSADRTYMETIQDAQHRFRWKDKHRFRPHQHFTYDPTSWSRPLEEKSKGDGARRVIDRLRYLREREEEQQQQQETHEYPSSSTPVRNNIHEGNDDDNVDGGMPDYFYDVDATTTTTTLSTDASAPRLTLQELVESADHYCSLIYAPRSSASSSSLRAHIHHVNALDEVLWHIFCRIQDGEVGTSFTWNALVISWRCLLMHPEATLHAIVRHYQASSSSSSSHQPPSTEMEAVPILYELIHRTLLQPLMCGNDFHLTTITSLEMCTELLFELSSPLVLKTSSESLGQHLRTTLLPSLLQLCMDQLDHVAHTHHVDEEVNDLGRPEWVSSMHAEMLMRVLLRMSELNVAACEAAITTARWSELSYLLRGGASYVLAILQRSVRGGPLRQATSTALHRRSLDDDDDGGPPRGIKIAATDSCDVGALIRATTSMLRAHTNINHSPSLSKPMDDALHTMLDMLAWAPNYDVGAADAVDLLTQLTESMKMWSEEMMMINNNNDNNMLHGVRREERIRRSLVHCVLLGSRLAWSTSTNKAAMAECVLRLAEVAPHFDDKASRAEYLRLRGVSMQQALMNLTVDDFQEMMAERVNEKNTSSSSSSSSMSWEELLANSSAASFAPLRLCVDAANCYFVRYNGTATSWRTADVDDHHGTHVVCSASTAEALILLFSRQLRPRRNPSDTRWQVVSAATMPLISACVAVASGTPTASLHATVMDMQVNPDVWEEMLHTTHLAGDADVEALIAAARQHAENKRVSQRHTVVL